MVEPHIVPFKLHGINITCLICVYMCTTGVCGKLNHCCPFIISSSYIVWYKGMYREICLQWLWFALTLSLYTHKIIPICIYYAGDKFLLFSQFTCNLQKFVNVRFSTHTTAVAANRDLQAFQRFSLLLVDIPASDGTALIIQADHRPPFRP